MLNGFVSLAFLEIGDGQVIVGDGKVGLNFQNFQIGGYTFVKQPLYQVSICQCRVGLNEVVVIGDGLFKRPNRLINSLMVEPCLNSL